MTPARRQADALEIDADGRSFRVSNPGKVFFAKWGETKLDLVRYYVEMGEAAPRGASSGQSS